MAQSVYDKCMRLLYWLTFQSEFICIPNCLCFFLVLCKFLLYSNGFWILASIIIRFNIMLQSSCDLIALIPGKFSRIFLSTTREKFVRMKYVVEIRVGLKVFIMYQNAIMLTRSSFENFMTFFLKKKQQMDLSFSEVMINSMRGMNF